MILLFIAISLHSLRNPYMPVIRSGHYPSHFNESVNDVCNVQFYTGLFYE